MKINEVNSEASIIIKYKSPQKGKFIIQEVITLTKEKKTKRALTQEEYSKELSPDDLDFREDNDLTHEQEKNSRTEKLKDKYNFNKNK